MIFSIMENFFVQSTIGIFKMVKEVLFQTETKDTKELKDPWI